MKTFSNLRRSVLAAVLTAGALTFLAPGSIFADSHGATQLLAAKAQLAPRSTAIPASTQSMASCARCKDSSVTVTEKNFKGSQLNSTKTAAAHLCPVCETKIVSEGAGKAKADKVVHTCGNSAGSAAACCMAAK